MIKAYLLDLYQRLILKRMGDKMYLKCWYKKMTGETIDFKHPITFNQKLQWIKLFDRKAIYTSMADKSEAKKIVARLIGEKYIIPTLGVYENFDEIDFSQLPEQFVLKCTHDSGSIIICRSKENFNFDEAKNKLEKCLREDYSWIGREWVYKGIPHRILAEQYMVDESGDELKDYKVFNFNAGEDQLIQVDFGRFSNHCRRFYTSKWEPVDMQVLYPDNPSVVIPKPLVLEEMLELARTLSKDMYFLRTDFYIIGDKIYFGEMTFYPGSGTEKILPDSMALKMGNWIKLPIEESREQEKE